MRSGVSPLAPQHAVQLELRYTGTRRRIGRNEPGALQPGPGDGHEQGADGVPPGQKVLPSGAEERLTGEPFQDLLRRHPARPPSAESQKASTAARNEAGSIAGWRTSAGSIAANWRRSSSRSISPVRCIAPAQEDRGGSADQKDTPFPPHTLTEGRQKPFELVPVGCTRA